MIHSLLPGALVYAAACQGYQLSPALVAILSGMCEYKTTIIIYEMIHLHPEKFVFSVSDLSDVLGLVVIEEVPA